MFSYVLPAVFIKIIQKKSGNLRVVCFVVWVGILNTFLLFCFFLWSLGQKSNGILWREVVIFFCM